MTKSLSNFVFDELTQASSEQTTRRERIFEAGQIKWLVLYLIEQAPKYAYEVIKQIGEIVGGGYSPSTGTIYPALAYLEEMQYIVTEADGSDRKQYLITAAGSAQLVKEQETIQSLLERFEVKRELHNNKQLIDACRAMENLKTALKMKLHQQKPDAALVRKIAATIDEAAVKITQL